MLYFCFLFLDLYFLFSVGLYTLDFFCFKIFQNLLFGLKCFVCVLHGVFDLDSDSQAASCGVVILIEHDCLKGSQRKSVVVSHCFMPFNSRLSPALTWVTGFVAREAQVETFGWCAIRGVR